MTKKLDYIHCVYNDPNKTPCKHLECPSDKTRINHYMCEKYRVYLFCDLKHISKKVFYLTHFRNKDCMESEQ